MKNDDLEVTKTESMEIVDDKTLTDLPEQTIVTDYSPVNKKNVSQGKTILMVILEMFFAVLALVWFFMPLYALDGQLVSTYKLPLQLYDHIDFNFSPLTLQKLYDLYLFLISNILYLIYLVPVISLIKIIGFFFKKKLSIIFTPGRLVPVFFNVINTALIILTFFQYIQIYANKAAFFGTISPVTYVINGLVLLFNVWSIFYLVKSINKKSTTYKGYLDLLDNIRQFSGKHDKKLILSIRFKLILSFITIFLLVIIVLSYTLMTDYRATILKSVEYNGKIIADQSATFFKENFSDRIDLDFYLKQQADTNSESDLPFEGISFYKKQGKTDQFAVEHSTDGKKNGYVLTDKELEAYKTSQKVYNDKGRLYHFIAPVTIGTKLIGFSVVSYNKDVIYESYFRTQVRVLMFTLIFLYIAVILVYLIGSRIALPILFLSMNVRQLSLHLTKMIRGEEKVSVNSLVYDDVVTSRDEIKSLSLEIDEMVTVIRGIIPYVSASTLQHADKSGAKSMSKNLTFLFTDIRGFTTMCEGMKPDEIVEILNNYLNLQTEIILANHGDIDKFVGDELMATFDGPHKEFNACMASLQLREAMEKERQERLKKNLSTINIGIGINTGPVVFGSVGAKDRMDFTSIGDTVNLAARLEGANKEYMTKTLISEDVFKVVSDSFICRQIDLVTVKGKTKPVKIYEVLEEKSKSTKETATLVKNFEKGLSKYRKKEWDAAIENFEKNVMGFNDEPSQVFIRRIKVFKLNPPPSRWNGVYVMNVYNQIDTVTVND